MRSSPPRSRRRCIARRCCGCRLGSCASLLAISALGMKTSFKALIDAGWRPLAVMVLETLWLAGLVLAVVETLT